VPEKVPPEVLLDELARGRRRRRGSDCGEREMLRAMAMKAIPDLASSSLSVDLEIHPRWAPTVHFRRKLRALLDSGVSVKDIVDRLLPPCEEVKDGRDWPRPAAKMEGGRRC
jgi:hypothetical protein